MFARSAPMHKHTVGRLGTVTLAQREGLLITAHTPADLGGRWLVGAHQLQRSDLDILLHHSEAKANVLIPSAFRSQAV
jgi:hypothetical protein